jgi:hypothetical protein
MWLFLEDASNFRVPDGHKVPPNRKQLEELLFQTIKFYTLGYQKQGRNKEETSLSRRREGNGGSLRHSP